MWNEETPPSNCYMVLTLQALGDFSAWQPIVIQHIFRFITWNSLMKKIGNAEALKLEFLFGNVEKVDFLVIWFLPVVLDSQKIPLGNGLESGSLESPQKLRCSCSCLQAFMFWGAAFNSMCQGFWDWLRLVGVIFLLIAAGSVNSHRKQVNLGRWRNEPMNPLFFASHSHFTAFWNSGFLVRFTWVAGKSSPPSLHQAPRNPNSERWRCESATDSRTGCDNWKLMVFNLTSLPSMPWLVVMHRWLMLMVLWKPSKKWSNGRFHPTASAIK